LALASLLESSVFGIKCTQSGNSKWRKRKTEGRRKFKKKKRKRLKENKDEDEEQQGNKAVD
jgi:hypothetical protein